jgi:hypothetical protein
MGKMALSAEEKAQLDALMAKDKEPDPDDDFEIEIYDGSKGARLPYRRGRSYLQEHFGIDLDPDPGKDAGDSGGKGGAKRETSGKTDDSKTGGKAGGAEETAQGYWSKRRREAS